MQKKETKISLFFRRKFSENIELCQKSKKGLDGKKRDFQRKDGL